MLLVSFRVRLLSIKNEEERYFYLLETIENNWSVRELNRQIDKAVFELETIENNWSVRELNRQIDKAVFERTVLSKEEIALPNHQNNELQPTDILKDPYILEVN